MYVALHTAGTLRLIGDCSLNGWTPMARLGQVLALQCERHGFIPGHASGRSGAVLEKKEGQGRLLRGSTPGVKLLTSQERGHRHFGGDRRGRSGRSKNRHVGRGESIVGRAGGSRLECGQAAGPGLDACVVGLVLGTVVTTSGVWLLLQFCVL